jgi:hypothetical protein
MAIPTSNAELNEPAETPEVLAEETVAEDSNSEVFSEEEVAELLSDDDDISESAPEPEPEEPAPEPEDTPAEEEPEPTEPEPEPPAETEEPEPEPEEPEIPEVPPEPEDTRTPEEVAAEITKARETAHEKLKEQFKMTEEQEELFDTNPSEVLAKMAADLYLDLYDSIVHSLQQQMPGQLAALMQIQSAKQQNERAFFKAWPQLAKPEYRATIERISDTYRAQNRNASAQDAIREIGAQAWVALRLPLDELLELTQSKPPAQEEPPAPTVDHVPAGTGAARGNDPAPRQLNEYEQLAEEFIQDDY